MKKEKMRCLKVDWNVGLACLFLNVVLLVMASNISTALPVPHGIDGKVYEMDGITEVRSGVDFYVHDATNGQIVSGKTGHGSSGRYSASLSGEDSDTIIIKVWNKYNQNNITLALHGVMRNVDLYLNMTFPALPPIIMSEPVLQATEDEPYAYHLIAIDDNDDQLEFSLGQSPPDMQIDSSNGMLRWVPSGAESGSNEVMIQVSDGLFTVNQTFSVEVAPVNDAPAIISIPPLFAGQDTPYLYDVDAKDEDNESLEYALVAGPAGMSINGSTGLIKWTPSGSQVDIAEVSVSVSDGNLSGVQEFRLNVSNVNDLPYFVSAPLTTAIEDEPYSYDADAIDFDGDALSYSLVESPAGMHIDSLTGLIQWTPGNDDVGRRNITLRVSDSSVHADQRFALEVLSVNDPPAISSTPVSTAIAGKNYAYDVDAYDPDFDTLSFALDIAPPGMGINPKTGLIRWKPKRSDVGSHEISISVSDGRMDSSQIFQLYVFRRKALTGNPLSGNFTIKVEELNSRPKDAVRFSRRVYKYLSINGVNVSSGIKSGYLINFSIKRSWLAALGINYSDVTMSRHASGEWEDLETWKVSQDEESVHYLARTEGFSYFAISVKQGIPISIRQKADISSIRLPFRMSGRIFGRNSIEVPKGTKFIFHNRNNSETVVGETGIGPSTGRFSVLMHGNRGDMVSVRVETSGREFITALKDSDILDFSLKSSFMEAAIIISALGFLLLIMLLGFFRRGPRGSQSFIWITLGIMILAASIDLATAPPSPHNVEGKVFTNASNGASNGITVSINNTVNGDYVLTYTNAPDVPELLGIYSATINGSDGDSIIVTAWNSTHYGSNATTLTSTTNVNVALNITRQSEANVTIIEPLNNSLRNRSIYFNVTANITMLGGNGSECNATLSISDHRIINITPGDNFTHAMGNISLGGFRLANWTVIGLENGSSNFTVWADCSSDGIRLDKVNVFSVWNITIKNVAPLISIRAASAVGLIQGGNLSLSCNASFTDANTASDIMIVNATLFQQSIGHNSADDRNFHYTNGSCSNLSSSDFQINYTCGFRVAYYANNGTWQCNMTGSDKGNATAFANTTFTVDELMALDVSPAIIDYGRLMVTNTSSTDFNLTMRNLGNVPINVSLRAYAPNESLAYLNLSMNCESGNISNANQRYSTINGTDFSQMSRTNNETIFINLTLHQRVDDAAYGNDTNYTFWKLQVPLITSGLCNGTVIFSASSAR